MSVARNTDFIFKSPVIYAYTALHTRELLGSLHQTELYKRRIIMVFVQQWAFVI